MALESLADAAPAAMTDVERARLHRGVRQGIAESEPVPSPGFSGKAMARLAVAAATVAVVGFVGGQLFTGGTDQAAIEEVAAELPRATREESSAADESSDAALTMEAATR